MKLSLIIIFIAISAVSLHAQKVIFLHHSTGGNVYSEGSVEEWINNYNNQENSQIEITERAYPNDPWGWENYPYDYWKLWIDGSCDNAETGIECLESIAQNYKVIIFKHCFPGAGINEDNSNGDITSDNKTIPNYKLQYRALRDLFDTMPDTKFIAWTLAPLHRNATYKEAAKRANEFSNWLKTEWLSEDEKEHPNIFVFDFYGLSAELGENPDNGQQYCLKYEYEGSHDGDDSHPNTLANQTIGPIFAQFIVDVALNNSSSSGIEKVERLTGIYPNILLSGQSFTVNAQSEKIQITIYNSRGQKIIDQEIFNNTKVNTEGFQKGIYWVILKSGDNINNCKLMIK